MGDAACRCEEAAPGHLPGQATCRPRLRGRGFVSEPPRNQTRSMKNGLPSPPFAFDFYGNGGGLTPSSGSEDPPPTRGPRKWCTPAASRTNLGAERPAWLCAKLARESRDKHRRRYEKGQPSQKTHIRYKGLPILDVRFPA